MRPQARSGRAASFLAGAVGGLAAWLTAAAQRAMPAEAAVGDRIRFGKVNDAGDFDTIVQRVSLGPAYLV